MPSKRRYEQAVTIPRLVGLPQSLFNNKTWATQVETWVTL